MSIVDWIERVRCRAGVESRARVGCSRSRTPSSTAASASEQSSLNMLYLLGYIGQGQLRILGPSNEKYHVRGGNDQITDRLAAALAGQVTARLASSSSIAARGRTARWTLTLRAGHEDDVSVRGGPGRDRRSRSRSCARSDYSTGRLLGAQGAGDPRARHRHELQVPPPVHATGSGTRSARTARRSPTAATRTRGRSRAGSRGARASSSTTPAGDYRRHLRVGIGDGPRRSCSSSRSTR